MKTIRELQTEVTAWSRENFGPDNTRTLHTAIGILEECGEFVHAVIKGEHGKRGGTPEYWANKRKDAIADSLVFLLDHCSCRGWDLVDLLNEAPVSPYRWTFKDVQDAFIGITVWDCLDSLMTIAVDDDPEVEYAFDQRDAIRVVRNWAFYCARKGWDLQEIFENTWDEVRARDMSKRTVTT